jgi:aminocarboxymuconate-semialdehyde decarboxylase
MDHAWKARPDCRTVIKKKPSSYLEKFYFDTITFDRGMLEQEVARFGADHVLLGTDYPYDMAEYNPIGHIAGVEGMDETTLSQITGRNAARLLGLEV